MVRIFRTASLFCLLSLSCAVVQAQPAPPWQPLIDDSLALYLKGRYQKSIEVANAGIAEVTRAMSAEHPGAAVFLVRIGEACRMQARYAEAEAALRRALRIFERVFGPYDRSVAFALTSFGLLRVQQNRVDEAEEMLLRAADIRKRNYGEDPSSALALNGLSRIYASRGEVGRAEATFKAALDIAERTAAPEHPIVAGTLANLAALYTQHKRYREAEAIYRRTLAVWQKSPENPFAVSALNGLGDLYRAEDRLDDAAAMYKKAIALVDNSLDRDHPQMADSLAGAASIQFLQGEYDGAEALYKRALQIRESTLGEIHPDTIRSMEALAEVHFKLGQTAEGEKLETRALDLRTSKRPAG